ncbi:TPA: hypothetical protein ACWZU0_000175 [Klebsiella oxytoca]|nr:hypothetical protein [Klebsiella oxytoca]MBL0805494.1 hypothetical protein [Klebsiella oxytoca]MBZ6769097.1 hypothetical protein [Klebsiella oxytoca]
MIPEQPARQDGVPLTFYIPGQCLSFSQYLWGARLARLALPERRRRLAPVPAFLISTLIMWLIFAFFASLSDGHYQFRLSAWSISDGAGEYLFRLRNSKVIAVFLGCYIVGVLTIRLLYRRFQRCWSRRFYDANGAIRSGYCLQLWEEGVSWMDHSNQNYRAFLAWRHVKGIVTHGKMDYLDLGTLGFLWIPVDLDAYPRAQVFRFIERHM